MSFRKIATALVLAAGLSGCGGSGTVQFKASTDQSAMMRDGRPAIVSRKAGSVVWLSPAAREMRPGQRPVFVVAATNVSRQPQDLLISRIEVVQISDSGSETPLQVISYEQLLSEERTRQVIGAIAVGLAAGANSYSAARAGHGNIYGTVSGPGGTHVVQAHYYDPGAAAYAQSVATAENAALIASSAAAGQRNLAALETNVLKDNTILPGEWVGGQVHLAPPAGETGKAKRYSITVYVGNDMHRFEVAQQTVAS